MSETHQLALGREAEDAWRRLRVAIEQEQRFAATLWSLEAADKRAFGDAIAELEARLSQTGSVTRIALGDDAADKVERVGAAGATGEGLPIALVVLDDPESDVARQTLASLNVRRDYLGNGGPVYLVVVSEGGDFALAPDLASVAVGPLHLTVEPAVAATVGPIGFVHVSDFHLNARDWTQKPVIEALVSDLPGLIEEAGVVPHLVFGTGDFAYAGKPEEFDRAQALLHELQLALAPLVPASERAPGGIEPRGPTEYASPRVYVVPGNHDVDRSKIRHAEPSFIRELLRLAHTDREQARVRLGGWWAPRESVEAEAGAAAELAADKLDAFYTFGARTMGAARAFDPGQAWRVDRQVVRGVAFGVLSLNTAWSCLPDDEAGRILVGERQVRDALDELEQLGGAEFTIALLHHPPRWWPEFERRTVRELLRKHCDLVLTGHEHDTDPMSHESGTNRVLHLAGGAVHAGGSHYNACQVGSIDPATGEVTVHMFRYSENDGGFWARDTLQRQGSDGRLVFDLGRTLGGGRSAPAESGASDALMRRLCEASANMLNRVDFIGIPATAAGKRQASIEAVFVPLTLAASDDDQQVPVSRLEHVLATRITQTERPAGAVVPRVVARAGQIVLGRDDVGFEAGNSRSAGSIVLLGAPGSGKTTLLRYLAWQATQSEHPRVPILIPLRDWVARGERRSLLAFAADEMTRVLATSVSESQLEEMAQSGDALLLIDGLDEVPADSMRAEVRDMVVALAHRFPRLPIVASSRVTGYDRSPLPPVFEQLTLTPFDDEQLSAFVRRWYSLQCPDDARKRNEQIARLESAFVAEPRANALARNPLFATLIAMVHYAEATLPGDRATLYEKLVEMMLVTWPRTSGARLFPDERLPTGRQREVLERLAFHLQLSRGTDDNKKESDGSVTITRPELKRLVSDVVAELVGLQHCDADELATAWMDYIAARTGLLVEQSPGVFAFLHLSVLEYLAGQRAAREWGNAGTTELAKEIVSRAGQDHWVETLLLLLGADAKNRPLADAVVEGLLATDAETEREGGGLLVFGLRALRDEVECSARVRVALLERVVRVCGDSARHGLGARKVLREIVEFSRLHAEPVTRWFEAQLAVATGQDFARAAWVAPELPAALIAAREDASWYVRDDVVFPGCADVAATLRDERGGVGPVEAGVGAALTGYGGVEALALPCTDLALASLISSARGLTDAAGATSAAVSAAASVVGRGHFALNVPATIAAQVAENIAQKVIENVPLVFAGTVSHEIVATVGRDLAGSVVHDFVGNLAHDFVMELPVGSAYDGPADLSWSVADNVATTFAANVAFDSLSSVARLGWPEALIDLPLIRDDDELVRWLSAALSPFLTEISGHVVLGMFASHGVDPAFGAERVNLAINDRILSLWHGMFHAAISEYLLNERGDTPDTRAALAASAVFAMQYNHRWPESDWFAAWRAADEPEHYREAWWWHLCNGIDEADNPVHMQRADAALERAPDDEETKEIVRFLRALNIQPCTQTDMDAQIATMKENWLNLVRKNRDAGMADPYMGWAEAGCWMLEEDG